MDPLRIDSPFDRVDFIKANLVRWEIHWLKNRKQLIGFTIASTIFLFLGLIVITKEESENPLLFFGIVFSILTILLLYIRLFSKRRFKQKIKEIAKRFETDKMDCTYIFSDDSIKYWDKEKTLEFKWSVFIYYTIYKEYLFIALNNSIVDAYLFKKEDAKIDEYEKILEFVKQKLNFKEIK